MGLSLRKRDGVWYARGRVVLADGTSVQVNRSTRIEVGPGTKRFAEQAAQRIADEARLVGRTGSRRGPDNVDPRTATVRDAVDAYRKRRDVSGDFITLIENFARTFGSVRLVDLDEDDILRWASSGPRLEASGRPAAPRTVQGRVKAVKTVLALASSKMGWLVADLDLRVGGLVHKQEKWLTAEERDRLLDAIEPHWRPIATALFMTGARPVELGRLTWGDILPPTRHQAYGRVILRHLKGQAAGALRWQTRDVPLVPQVRGGLGKPGRSGEFVFRDTEGGALVESVGRLGRTELTSRARAEMGAAFSRAAELAGLSGRGVTPYWARHTFASLLVQENVPLQVVAELLGHTSTREIERTYGHLAPHQKERAMAALGNVVALPAPAE